MFQTKTPQLIWGMGKLTAAAAAAAKAAAVVILELTKTRPLSGQMEGERSHAAAASAAASAIAVFVKRMTNPQICQMEEEGNLTVRTAVVAARVMEPIAVKGEALSLLMHPTREEALFQPRIEPVTNFVEKAWIRLSLLWKV